MIKYHPQDQRLALQKNNQKAEKLEYYTQDLEQGNKFPPQEERLVLRETMKNKNKIRTL